MPERTAGDATTGDLAGRAADTHVVVIGGGIGGLVAARECAKVGMRVTVVDEADAVGGVIRRADLDGVAVDAGAESYATRGGHVRALLSDLGLAERIVAPGAGGAWLAGLPGGDAAPLPVGGLLGIPANPFQEDVRRIIGWGGAWRAYADRLRPPLTIGHDHSLGKLVRSRMGAKVRDRLVAPVTTGVYSALPEDIDVDVAAPGLNAALTRTGSLSGAVQTLRDEAAARAAKASAAATGSAADVAPGAAVEGIAGGMTVLIDALVAELVTLGAEVRPAVRANAVDRDGSTWNIDVEVLATAPSAIQDGASHAAPSAVQDAVLSGASDAAQDAVPRSAADLAVVERLHADAIIVATAEPIARSLLSGAVPALAAVDSAAAPEIEIVTLLLDAPALDAAPRGTGVLTVPGSRIAKALTHSSAKWGWVREAAGGRHVVRVSFGAQGEPAATAGLDDAGAARLALTEASALLGVPLAESALVAAHRARFTQSQPASIIGAGARRLEARTAVRGVPGLAVVGAWIAGTGLAQVIPDALDEAKRLRHSLLWG